MVAAPGNGMCQGYARWPSPAEARASRSILTRTRRQSAKRELHSALRAAALSPPAGDTRRLHSSRCKELRWCPHHARQCTMQDQYAYSYNYSSHFAVWPEPKAPYRRSPIPETSKNRGTALLWARDGPLYRSEGELSLHKTSD